MKKKIIVTFVVIVFFIISFLFTYFILTLLPLSYHKQRVYSTPSNEENVTSSTMGGEALVGIEDDESPIPPIPVFLGPRPGASNVSLNTEIYVFQTRPVDIDLQIHPKVTFGNVKEEYSGVASRNTIYYPAELLEPNTTYNVSGSIMGYSAWWIFTTGSSIIQPEYQYDLEPYTWWVAIIVACIATVIFVPIILRKLFGSQEGQMHIL